jgi:outer membrane protein OmpA-like peptidoglycan-associated protein
MRRWCVTFGVSAMLALPVCAQQAARGTNDDTNAAAANAENKATAEPESGTNAVPRTGVFALPATPRPTPFPGPADKKTKDDRAPGQLLPKYEAAGMYQYLNFMPGDPFKNFNNHGGTLSFAYNMSRWLGLVAEGGLYHGERNDLTTTGSGGVIGTSGTTASYLFGPRLNWRKFDHFVPFAEFLIGGAHAPIVVTGDKRQNAFALATGGGVDWVLTKNIAWRVAQLDYFMTTFDGSGLGNSRQNNFRAGTGVVFRWGIPNPPPPPNRPPVAACTTDPTQVYAGAGTSVAIHVNASDPDNDPLTYAYSATGGTVEGTGPDARWNSTGVNPGTYTVNVKVDDGKGGSAACAADVTVAPPPNRPPTATLTVERSPILPGERTGITCHGEDPDGDPLTYSYTTTGGQITGTGEKVQFDSTGLQPGSYTVKCTVNDGKGGTADASGNVDVQQPTPPPQATKVGDCGYTKPGASRFDNACKRVGDDVALRLKNDPAAKVVIVGYADPKEPKASKLALERAELAKKYLGEKGIDASRVSTRAGSGSAEKGMEKENRRVDFVLVPEGATY